MKNFILLLLIVSYGLAGCQAENDNDDILVPHLGNLYTVTDGKTRSISPENFTGEKGRGGMATLEEGSAARAARELGQGWKSEGRYLPLEDDLASVAYWYQAEPHNPFPELPEVEDLVIKNE